MAAYPVTRSKSEPPAATAIPETKFFSKSLIIKVAKPIFEELDNMEEGILRNLECIITRHAKEFKKRTKLEIGTNKLIFELYDQERILSSVRSIEPGNVVNLGKLLKEYASLMEEIKTAKKISPEKLEGAIDTLSSSGKFKPETIVIMNALVPAIPSKQSE